ncbi:hypothetical protein NMY22_g18693 [Coprinellus aureogranulatus]|nr:hypothetical protein NMY22_g18693 [Coprinellus aureogranulatus]
MPSRSIPKSKEAAEAIAISRSKKIGETIAAASYTVRSSHAIAMDDLTVTSIFSKSRSLSSMPPSSGRRRLCLAPMGQLFFGLQEKWQTSFTAIAPEPVRGDPIPAPLLPVTVAVRIPPNQQPFVVDEDYSDEDDDIVQKEVVYEGQETSRVDEMKRNPLFIAARTPYVDPVTRPSCGSMDVVCPNWGCAATSEEACLDSIPEPPEPLCTFLTSLDDARARFREDPGSTTDRPPVFQIAGELYHCSGPLTAANTVVPRYSQLYIVEPRAAVDDRIELNDGLDRNIMDSLDAMLRENHQYVPVYKHACGVPQNYAPDDAVVSLRLEPGLNKRRYNMPTVDEVAVVLPGVTTKGRDIILRLHQGDYLDRMSAPFRLCPSAVPSTLPSRHPGVAHDEDAEEGGDPQKLMQWAAYRIMPRVGEFNTLLYGNRLFLHLVVDIYRAVDQTPFLTARLNHLEDANMNDPDNLTTHEIALHLLFPILLHSHCISFGSLPATGIPLSNETESSPAIDQKPIEAPAAPVAQRQGAFSVEATTRALRITMTTSWMVPSFKGNTRAKPSRSQAPEEPTVTASKD